MILRKILPYDRDHDLRPISCAGSSPVAGGGGGVLAAEYTTRGFKNNAGAFVVLIIVVLWELYKYCLPLPLSRGVENS